MEMTRDRLIDVCDRAIVHEDRWNDRDTAGAQKGVGTALAYLRANVPYKILTEGRLVTDDETIWLEFQPKGFGYFEDGEDGERDSETIYLPTLERLYAVDGGDWY